MGRSAFTLTTCSGNGPTRLPEFTWKDARIYEASLLLQIASGGLSALEDVEFELVSRTAEGNEERIQGQRSSQAQKRNKFNCGK